MDQKAAIALQTSLAAGRILSSGAQKLSLTVDKFSSWLLAGFGAAFGLLIANFSSLSEHLSASSLKVGASFFLVAATFAALQKLLAAFVLASTTAAEDGRNFGAELASSDIPLDVESMYSQVNRGLFWPLNRFNEHITQIAKAGDYAVIGRHHAKASQLQVALVIAQSALSIVSAAYVVGGIAI
ncbi:hypothetical protein [Cognatiluteimonas weifangensis]|uniref:hypothetical protein n=1 Tax=Cognatiluteimonas weifangensis TaxID=2303539 RepID=UPI0011C14F34|nr:hypothetical protein [Luteimonas weifangensis]